MDLIALLKIKKINSELINKMNIVSSSHIFTNTSERDTYFVNNSSEKVVGRTIQITGSGFSTWNGSSWVPDTSIISVKGDKGDKGDTGATGTTNYNNLTNKPTIPTDTSELTKSDVYTKAEIDAIIASISNGITPNYVRITTTGSTFFPVIELASGSTATVAWELEGGSTYTGITPNIDFGTAATRYIRMTVTNNGVNAISDVITFNVGFDHTQDAGLYNIGATYDHASQSVSSIEYVNKMTGLKRFLAATPTLACSLDFTGMSSLEFIECYGAAVTSVTLTGCTGLIRLCMEGDDLAALDLNPVAANLYDLRASGNRSPLTLTPLTSPMAHLYHYCAQSETVINHPTSTQLPVIRELWDWNSAQSGALVVRSSAIESIISYGNSWTSVDLANQFPAGRGGSINLANCQLTSVILTGCNGLDYIVLQNNSLGQTAVDNILSEVESWGTSNGTLNLSGNTGPSSTGSAKVTTLRSRGWTVTTEATTEGAAPSISSSYSTTSVYTTTDVSIPYTITDTNGGTFTASYVIDSGTPTVVNSLSAGLNTWAVGTLDEGEHTLTIQVTDSTSLSSNTLTFSITSSVAAATTLWEDTFDRTDCTGIANVGNGWTGRDCNIVSGDLVITGAGAYGTLVNPTNVTLPSDYTVTMGIPAGTNRGDYWGLVGRWYNGTGVNIFWTDNNTSTYYSGAAESYGGTAITLTYPTDWANNTIEHTVALKMVGTTITVILDGQTAGSFTSSVNATQTGTGIGFCGESQNRHRSYIKATS